MGRLIDADALEREGWSLCRNYQQDKNTMVYETKSIAEIPTAQPEEKVLTEEDYAYCLECNHVEMCRWYPTYGCEFKGRQSAQPERKKGVWKDVDPYGDSGLAFICSNCKKINTRETNYCPNCGCEMER